MIALLLSAKLVGLGYNLALEPDAKVVLSQDTVWLSQTQNPDSILSQLPEKQQREILDHILFPRDRQRVFGKQNLLKLAGLHHKLEAFSRIKKLRQWLPPGADRLLKAFHKDRSVSQAKELCLAAAYDVALADYLIEKASDLRFGEKEMEFVQDVLFSGPVSMSPDQALEALRSLSSSKGKSPVASLRLYKKKRSRLYSQTLSEYYALVQKSSPKASKAREFYLKGVDAYAEGDYSRAILWWNKALKLDPQNQEIKTALEKARKLAGK